MEKTMTYNEAFEQLENVVEQLEEGNIQLDELAVQVAEANKLIALCESKLRNIEIDVAKEIGD